MLLVITGVGVIGYRWLNPSYECLTNEQAVGPVEDLAFFPSGHNVLGCVYEDHLGFWTLDSHSLCIMPMRDACRGSLTVLPGGKTFAVGSGEYTFVNGFRFADGSRGGKLRIYDWATKKQIIEISGLRDEPRAMTHSEYLPYLASSAGSEVIIWNTKNWRRIGSIDVSNFGGKVVQFINMGKQLIFGNSDGLVGVYDIGTREIRTVATIHESIIGVVAREEPDTDVVVLTRHKLLTVDLKREAAEVRVEGFDHGMGGCAICYSKAREAYAVGMSEHGEVTFRRARVVLFDERTMAIVERFTGIPGGIKSLCASRDGELIACAGLNGEIRILRP